MTDVDVTAAEWVPRFGQLRELSADRAALIRGLFELAAWVADHPDAPVPVVRARFFAESSEYHAERELVDQLVVAFGNEPVYSGPGSYRVSASFGPIVALASFGPPEDYATSFGTEAQQAEAEPGAEVSGGDAR